MTTERTVEVWVGGDREVGGGARQHLKKGGLVILGVLHKIRG